MESIKKYKSALAESIDIPMQLDQAANNAVTRSHWLSNGMLRLGGAIVICLFWAALTTTFVKQPTKIEKQFPVLTSRDSVPQIPVSFSKISQSEALHVHQLALEILFNPSDFEFINFTVATHNDKGRLVNAEFVINNSVCKYVSTPESQLIDNHWLTLRRNRDCDISNFSGILTGVLTVTNEGASKLAAWTKAGPLVEKQLVQLHNPNDKLVYYPLGLLAANQADHPSRRSQLLTYVWGLSDTREWLIYFFLAASLTAVLTGLSFTIRSYGAPLRVRNSWLASLGPALMFFGIGLSYVIVVPPFQAPDEPDHVLTFAQLTGRTYLNADGLSLANKGHFERIKYHNDQRFSAFDMNRPLVGVWAGHVTPTGNDRSLLSKYYWLIMDKALPSFGPNLIVMILRSMNLLIVSLVIYFGIFLLERCEIKVPMVVASIVLLVPSLPFFSMHVSNYCFLISGWILQGIILIGFASALGNAHMFALGFGTGAALVLQVLGGSAGIAGLSFSAVVVGGHFLFSERSSGVLILSRRFLDFLRGLFFPTLICLLMIYFDRPEELLSKKLLEKILVVDAAAIFNELKSKYFLYCFGALVALLSILRIRLVNCNDYFRYVLFGSILTLFCASALTSAVYLPEIEVNRSVGQLDYVVRVLGAFFQGLAFKTGDGLIVTSFWSGFGWLDAMLPDRHTAIVKTLLSIGILACGFCGLRQFSGRTVATILFGYLGIAVWLTVLALGYYSVYVNLHGRYLIGVYIAAISLASLCLIEAKNGKDADKNMYIYNLLLVVGLVISHTFALESLVVRYFG